MPFLCGKCLFCIVFHMCWMAKTRDIQGEILESLRGGLGYIVYRDFANIISLFSTRELALAG